MDYNLPKPYEPSPKLFRDSVIYKAFIEGDCYDYNSGESDIVYLGGAESFRVEEMEVYKLV